MDIAFEGRGTTGPALLLLHGFPLDRRMWREQLAGLADEARVIAVDLPGCGSSPARGGETIASMADAVIALADALGLARFVLGGLSMGGYVVLAALARHADRLAGIILCDTRAEADTPATRAARLDDAERIVREGPGFYARRALGNLLAPGLIAALGAEIEGWITAQRRAGLAAGLRAMADRPDARAQLGAIAVPALVLGGAEDALTPPAAMRALADAIPGATHIVVPGGHLAPLEHPAEANAAIGAFLRRP